MNENCAKIRLKHGTWPFFLRQNWKLPKRVSELVRNCKKIITFLGFVDLHKLQIIDKKMTGTRKRDMRKRSGWMRSLNGKFGMNPLCLLYRPVYFHVCVYVCINNIYSFQEIMAHNYFRTNSITFALHLTIHFPPFDNELTLDHTNESKLFEIYTDM